MDERKKIKVLVVPSDRFGCGLYRSVSPHTKLDEMFGDEFQVDIEYAPDWANPSKYESYDIVHVHKGLYENMDIFWSAMDYFNEHKIVVIIDVDDNWDVGPQHPLYLSNKAFKAPEKICENLKRADYVTTTTTIFAQKIYPHNKNVFVYPNAIDPTEEQYNPVKNPSKKIRFGFVMGSAHEKDMEQFKGVTNLLYGMGVLDKIQLVLCGYDLRGTVTLLDKDGNQTGSRPIKPTESVWYSYEKTVTDDYRFISPTYKDFLLRFMPGSNWPMVEGEMYRREWTKDINEFAKHYRNVDVLLCPLAQNGFNEVKSELKFIEAGFTNTAIIASDFGPYTLISKNLIEFGGEINSDGNCILVDPAKKAKGWAKAIKKLVDNPELITLMKNNLHDTVKDRYDIRNVTKRRAEWYKEIVAKKKAE